MPVAVCDPNWIQQALIAEIGKVLVNLVEQMKKMLILVENGVEDSEFIYPYYRFQEEGYKMDIVAPKVKKEFIGKHGVPFTSEVSPYEVNLGDYDALIIPGDQAPDRMRVHRDLVEMVREASSKGKIIAAVGGLGIQRVCSRITPF